MILLLFFLFAIITIIYVIDPKNGSIKNAILVALVIVLALVAGLRGEDVDNDYAIYYDKWRTRNVQADVEYSFILIKNLVKSYLDLDFRYLLLVYAVLGVGAKLYAIKKLSPFLFGSILIYFSNYYLLHELTQIRIGVATGFILIAYHYLCQKQYMWFFILTGIAIFFHQTSAVVLFLFFLSNTNKNFKVYLFLIPLGYLLYFSNTYLNLTIPIPFFQDKIDVYKEATESGFLEESKVNVFNIVFLLKILIFYILAYYAEKISEGLLTFYFLLKTYAISLFTFLLFSNIPVFAFRIQELFGVVEIILFPSIILIFSVRFNWIGKLLVWCLAVGLLLIAIYYVKLILQ